MRCRPSMYVSFHLRSGGAASNVVVTTTADSVGVSAHSGFTQSFWIGVAAVLFFLTVLSVARWIARR